jgi:hypothetical protein
MVGCSKDLQEPKNRRVVLRQRISVPPDPSPGGDPLARIGRSAGRQTLLPVLPVWHTWQKFLRRGSALPRRANAPLIDLTLIDLTLWLLTTLVEAFVACLFLIRGLFRKFLFLNFYLLLSATISIGRYVVLYHFGFTSPEYGYFYYFSDALLTITLFICVGELSLRLVGDKMPRGRVALWGAGALLAIALFSLSDASSWGYRVAARFVIELSQNIFFACSLGIVLLWLWKLRNDPEDRFAARFVNVLGVYFSLFVLIYGAHRLVPHASGIGNLYPMLGAWLPLGCGFAVVSHQ